MQDEEAFRTLARRAAPDLQRAAYLLCGDWHVAQDLVQTTLTNAYVHWRRVSGADNPDAYLHTMLLNAARTRWRRRGNREALRAHVRIDGETKDHAAAVVEHDALLTALLSLPMGQRATVVLRHLLGLSEAETATAMNTSVGTVKSQTSRALSALRRHLTEESFT